MAHQCRDTQSLIGKGGELITMPIGSIVRNVGGLIVGRVENRIFIKEVHGTKHMLRQPMAWAIDADLFDRVVVPNCSAIHIVDRGTGTRYITAVTTFQDKRQTLDRGYGKQYFLELIYWQAQKVR